MSLFKGLPYPCILTNRSHTCPNHRRGQRIRRTKVSDTIIVSLLLDLNPNRDPNDMWYATKLYFHLHSVEVFFTRWYVKTQSRTGKKRRVCQEATGRTQSFSPGRNNHRTKRRHLLTYHQFTLARCRVLRWTSKPECSPWGAWRERGQQERPR